MNKINQKREIDSNRNAFGLAKSSVNYYKHSSFYVYLIMSKPNWFELEDNSGKKLILPPTWYVGSTMHLKRLQEYKSLTTPLKEETQRRRHPNKYIKDNNLKLDFDYYFDIYVLDLGALFWCIGMEKCINRNEMQMYKLALEANIKYNMEKYFIVDGEAIINRFKHIWGEVKDNNYLKFSIEKIRKISKQRNEDFLKFQCFMEEVQKKEEKIVVESFVALTLEEALEINKKKYKLFRKNIDGDIINKHTLLF